jgi:prolyl-tRNA synthetase
MAPIQVVVVPVRTEPEIIDYCQQIVDELKKVGVRVEFDSRDGESFGYKVNKWEVKGVPLTAKIGMKEAEAGVVTLKARYGGEERQLKLNDAPEDVQTWLEDIQSAMLAGQGDYLRENTRKATTYDEYKGIVKEHKGFVEVYWNDNSEVEKRVKDETKTSSRCRLENDGTTGVDFVTGEPANERWIFAQSY